MALESRAHSLVIKNRSHIFMISILILHILYLAVFMGVAFIDESYIRNFSTIIQTFVSVFLAIRFNPFTTDNRITEFDKQVIFYSATFLLLNVVATEVYTAFIERTPLDPFVKSIQSAIEKLKGIKPISGFQNGIQKTT